MARVEIDELVAAVEAVRVLKDALLRQDTALEAVLARLETIEARLVALEDASHPP